MEVFLSLLVRMTGQTLTTDLFVRVEHQSLYFEPNVNSKFLLQMQLYFVKHCSSVYSLTIIYLCMYI